MSKDENKRQKLLNRKRRKKKERDKAIAATKKTRSSNSGSFEHQASSAAVGAPPYFRELKFTPAEEPLDRLELMGAELELLFYDSQDSRRIGWNGVPVCLTSIVECTEVNFPTVLSRTWGAIGLHCSDPRRWRIRLKVREFVHPEFPYGEWLLRQGVVSPQALEDESLLTTSLVFSIVTARAQKSYLPFARQIGLEVLTEQRDIVYLECGDLQDESRYNDLQVDRFWEVLMFVREYLRARSARANSKLLSATLLEERIAAVEADEADARLQLDPAYETLQSAELHIESLRAQIIEIQERIQRECRELELMQSSISDPALVENRAAELKSQALSLAGSGQHEEAERLINQSQELSVESSRLKAGTSEEHREYERARERWLRQRPGLDREIKALKRSITSAEKKLVSLRSKERSVRSHFDRLWWQWQKLRFQLQQAKS